MTELQGATIVPHARAKNATEFAAIWNNRTPEQREDIFQSILAASDTAFKCHTQHRDSQTPKALEGEDQ